MLTSASTLQGSEPYASASPQILHLLPFIITRCVKFGMFE
jgi:hypothetical protein